MCTQPAPGHDDDGVLKGHLAALAVCDESIVQDLQQDVEHICMSLHIDHAKSFCLCWPAKHPSSPASAALAEHVHIFTCCSPSRPHRTAQQSRAAAALPPSAVRPRRSPHTLHTVRPSAQQREHGINGEAAEQCCPSPTAPAAFGMCSVQQALQYTRSSPTWGSADEAADGVLLHVLGHVDAHDGLLGVEQVGGQRLGQLRFADTGGAQEHEGCDRPVGVAQPGARPAGQPVRCGSRTTLPAIALLAPALLTLGAWQCVDLVSDDKHKASPHCVASRHC